MNHGRLVAGLIAGLGVGTVLASSPDNPYRIIAEKNPFRLEPPPVPVVAEPPKVEEKTNLRFTGLSWEGSAVSAWLVIDSLEPGGSSTYLSLAPGEKASGVEILGIDEATQKVKVQYRDKPLTLAMETGAAAVGPGGRTIPGPGMPPRSVPTTLIQGMRPVPPSAGAVANPTGGGGGGDNRGFPSMPRRPVRGGSSSSYGAGAVANPSPQANQGNNSATGASRPLTLEESTIAVEVQRAVQPPSFPPLPPTGLSQ